MTTELQANEANSPKLLPLKNQTNTVVHVLEKLMNKNEKALKPDKITSLNPRESFLLGREEKGGEDV